MPAGVEAPATGGRVYVRRGLKPVCRNSARDASRRTGGGTIYRALGGRRGVGTSIKRRVCDTDQHHPRIAADRKLGAAPNRGRAEHPEDNCCGVRRQRGFVVSPRHRVHTNAAAPVSQHINIDVDVCVAGGDAVMAAYSASMRTTSAPSAGSAVAAEIAAAPDSTRLAILEIGISGAGSGFTNQAWVMRSDAQGIPAPGGFALFAPDEGGGFDVSLARSKLVVAWSRRPVVATTSGAVVRSRIRQANYSSGLGVCWLFPRGLMVPAGSSVVIWVDVGGTTLFDIWASVDT